MCGQGHEPAMSETGKYLVREGLRMEGASGTGEVGQQKLGAGCVAASSVPGGTKDTQERGPALLLLSLRIILVARTPGAQRKFTPVLPEKPPSSWQCSERAKKKDREGSMGEEWMPSPEGKLVPIPTNSHNPAYPCST